MSQRVEYTAPIPSEDEVAEELTRLKRVRRYQTALITTVYALIVVAAVAVLLATLFLPVLQVSGTSMEPTLDDQDVIVLVKGGSIETGDLVGFYYQNKLLLKRVIGTPGDVIDIAEDGTVSVNGQELDEPYVTNLSLGQCDINFPYQVPENRYFVMGDNREVSIDSRTTAIGCIEKEQILGKVRFRIYPIRHMSYIGRG